MAGPPITPRSISSIKAKLLQPSLTSHFICDFPIPTPLLSNSGLPEWSKRLPYNVTLNDELTDKVQLFCSEASLPGASLLTHEINNDYTGVTERHAYRRSFDDRADFTFYVDRNYDIIKFFQLWISYIANEKQYEETGQGPNYALGIEGANYNYRVRFPIEYQTNQLTITKFERDFSSPYLEYKFFNAFPISINSMPVSYDSSQLLKCTVSFTYSRYIMKDVETASGLTAPPEKIVGVESLPNGIYKVEYFDENNVIQTIFTNTKPTERRVQ